MVLNEFFVISFPPVFLPTTLASLPPGVMLLNRSATSRDGATDIEKTSQKAAPEREWPNRSLVKIYYTPSRFTKCSTFNIEVSHILFTVCFVAIKLYRRKRFCAEFLQT